MAALGGSSVEQLNLGKGRKSADGRLPVTASAKSKAITGFEIGLAPGGRLAL
jgi:hypothetical protein